MKVKTRLVIRSLTLIIFSKEAKSNMIKLNNFSIWKCIGKRLKQTVIYTTKFSCMKHNGRVKQTLYAIFFIYVTSMGFYIDGSVKV